jgi:hypothetical protein
MPLECETSGKPPARSRSFQSWLAGSRDPSRSGDELRPHPPHERYLKPNSGKTGVPSF